MKELLSKYLVVFILVIFSASTFAQTTSFEAAFDTLTIKDQFEHLYKRSNTFEVYKVMSISGYNSLKQNSIDSIRQYHEEVSDHQQEITTLKNNLRSTSSEIENLKEELASTQKAKDSISLIGIPTSKGSYNSIMWGLIICLAVILLIVVSLYKRGHQIVKETKTRLTEVQEDLENLRKNALVREQKLARELMDYKLKHKPSR
ncbi:hypothetical protein [Sunxiuqinia sp. sy24]|uniref:hypothetical protein n=1 Tax=Sunxiuqinia sp. sy24 TaxID=3461495 RepID=UPI00404678BA